MSIRWRSMVILAVLAVVITACSNGGASTAPSAAPESAAAPSAAAPSAAPSVAASAAAEPVTIDWWHITTDEPGKPDFQAIADAYMAAHPNVKINITVLENEAFKTKLAATPPDAYPDLFQSWGGGTMAAQADAGLLQDITSAVADWKDTINPGAMSIYQYKGAQYGIPWDMGMIGFWYNKDLFAKAGITAPPATWDEFLAAIPKLKAAGVAPLAIAGKDKWPSMHLWTYLVLREGGGDALSQMIQSGNWNTDACIKAGQAVAGAQQARSVPEGLCERGLQRRGRGRRQRQGRDGADGPVGAGGPEGPERQQDRASATSSAGSRSPWSPAVPAPRPTASAAATGSRSARTRRPRPSTS